MGQVSSVFVKKSLAAYPLVTPAQEGVRKSTIGWISGPASFETAAPQLPQDEEFSQCHQRLSSC
jgi:hypothetical protein